MKKSACHEIELFLSRNRIFQKNSVTKYRDKSVSRVFSRPKSNFSHFFSKRKYFNKKYTYITMLRVVHTALLALLLPVAQCEYVVDERCWAVLEKADVCSDTSPPGGLAERMADCIEIGSACHSVLCTGHNCYALSYAPSIVDHALRISNPTCFKQKPGMMRYLKTCDLQDVEFEHQTPITVCKIVVINCTTL